MADDEHYVVRPGERADFERLIASARGNGRQIVGVVHAWSLRPANAASSASERPSTDLSSTMVSLTSLLVLAQALSASGLAAPFR